MRNIILISILAIGLFQTRAALADANLCNSSQHTIWANYGEQTFHEDYWNGTSYTTAWISGWFQTQPGQCSTPEVGDVCFWWAYFWNNCPDAVFFYADDAFGDQWGGWGASDANNTFGDTICTTNNAFFESPQEQWQNPNCPSDRIWRFWGGMWINGPTDDVNITFGS
jgi:hypothetical protein